MNLGVWGGFVKERRDITRRKSYLVAPTELWVCDALC